MIGNSGRYHGTDKTIQNGSIRCTGANFSRRQTSDALSSHTWIGQKRSMGTLPRDRQEHTDQNVFSLLVFLVDHIAGTIEQKQVVNLCDTYFCGIYGIHARGNIILCFYEHRSGWGITVSELGPDPAPKLFNLSVNEVSLPPRVSPVESYMMCRVCCLSTFSFSWCLRMQ